jgi:glycogen(starch) synthase
LMYRSVELAAQLGIGHKVLFTGFLRGDDVRRIFRMADLYVMPSVSEPFGIAPLEALKHKVPVLVSKTSGIAEILNHALKVDFWDINQMANKIVAVLSYPVLSRALREQGHSEMQRFRWDDSAARVKRIYEEVLAGW